MLRKQARRAQVSYAIFRWESAVTVALTLILATLFPDPFAGALGFWRWWFWLVLGLFAEVLIVFTSLHDPSVRQRVVGEALRATFKPDTVTSPRYRRALSQAIGYREQIEILLQRASGAVLRAHLKAVADGITAWTGQFSDLVHALDGHHSTEALNEGGRAAMDRARQQLDDTLQAMANIYAQLQLISSKADSERIQRLRDQVAEQVGSLYDRVQELDNLVPPT